MRITNFWAIVLGLALGAKTLAASLTLGTPVTGELNQPGAEAEYTFNGTPGQRVLYDALSTDSLPINARLTSPSGITVFERNSRSDVEPITLLESGIYTLRLKGSGATIGGYSFRLVDAASQPEAPLETVITKTLTPGVAGDFYTINGTAGARLYFDGVGGAGGTWTLYAPNNQSLSSAGINGDFEVTLAQSGTFVLAIWGGSATAPVTYSLQVGAFTITTNPLALNTTVSGLIAKPGDQRAFAFNGVVGQKLLYDALNTDAAQINVRLITPGGVVALERNSRTDIEPFTLTESGTYTLVLDGNGAGVGGFSFRLVDVAAQPTLTLDAVLSRTLTPGTFADVHRFSGTAGQTIYFDGQTANNAATWYVYAPNNQQLSGASIGGDFEVTLPQTGPYTVVIWGNSPAPLPYSVRVGVTVTPATTVTVGTVVADSLVNTGDQHVYTFNGTAGQRLYYDSLNRQYPQINARFVAPSGAVLWEGNVSNDYGPVELPASGAYRLLIDAAGAAVGNYSFRLLDLASFPALTFGSAVAGQLNPASSTVGYSFNGTAGQRFNFKTVSAAGNQAAWRLVAPSSQTLATTTINADLGTVVLSATGPYALMIEGSVDNAVPFSFQFIAADQSEGAVAASGLGETRSGTISAGQQEVLSFTAPAGLWVYYDSMDRTAGSLIAELRDSANALVFSISAGTDSGPYILPRSGAYTLTMKGSSPAATGTFRYRLLNLNAAPALTLNNTLAATLDPAYRTDIYVFNGQAGQRLVYDSLFSSGDSISDRLIAPDGQIKHLNGNSVNDAGPFTLAASGRYYLVFESNMATPASYTARLLDINTQPDLVYGAITPAFDPGLAVIIYKFLAAPGQRFSFAGQGIGSGTMVAFGPNNENLGSAGFNGFFEFTAAQAGLYALVLSGAGTTPFTGSFGAYQAGSAGAQAGDITITSISSDIGNVTVQWTSSAGKTYRVLYKTNVEDPTWLNLSGDVTATGASSSKEDTTLGSAVRRFYRVQSLP